MRDSRKLTGRRTPATAARSLAAMVTMVVALAIGLPITARAESLLDLYRLAQQNDPALRAAGHALAAAQEKLPQARAGLRPQVSATAARTHSHGFYNFAPNPDSEREVTSWLNEPIPSKR